MPFIRPGRRRSLAVAALIVVAALGAAAAAVVVLAGGGSKHAAKPLPTTGQYAPLTIPKPRLIHAGALILNLPDANRQNWVSTALSALPGRYRYRVSVTNASNIGAVDVFEWYPPPGVRVLTVTGSSAGRCRLTGLTGFGGNQFSTVLLYPNILCSGVSLKAPSCTCRGDGGTMSFSVILDRLATAGGAARVLAATPSLAIIPSYASS